MTTTTSVAARTEVLWRIRAGKGGFSDGASARVEWEGLARGYRRAATRGREAVLELLEDRLRDYDAHVVRVGRGDVAANVAAMLQARGKRRMVVPAGLPAD